MLILILSPVSLDHKSRHSINKSNNDRESSAEESMNLAKDMINSDAPSLVEEFRSAHSGYGCSHKISNLIENSS